MRINQAFAICKFKVLFMLTRLSARYINRRRMRMVLLVSTGRLFLSRGVCI
jgi:hypothetical protein